MKWEYKVLRAGEWSATEKETFEDDMEEELDMVGMEGWELITVLDRHLKTEKWIFKRGEG